MGPTWVSFGSIVLQKKPPPTQTQLNGLLSGPLSSPHCLEAASSHRLFSKSRASWGDRHDSSAAERRYIYEVMVVLNGAMWRYCHHWHADQHLVWMSHNLFSQMNKNFICLFLQMITTWAYFCLFILSLCKSFIFFGRKPSDVRCCRQ